MYDSAMKSQWPGGVGVLAPSAHLIAIARCSRVRWVTMSLTSARSRCISGDVAIGGGPGRSLTSSSGVIIQVFTLPNSGSIGGRAGMSWLIHGTSPRALAASVSDCQIAALPPAVPMPSALARVMNT